MAVTTNRVVNESYVPDETEEQVLDVLTDGRERGEPWGYTTPTVAGNALDLRRQYTSRALQDLTKAGWVEQVGRGVYRYVEDPRNE
jgi:DNA-binding IclR family transcriptional regulator